MASKQDVPLSLSFTLKGREQDAKFPGGKLTLGRSRDCDVVIEDASVSRRHATLELTGGRWVLTDLNSANGTLVGGRQISSQVVGNGDVLQLGKVVVHCTLTAPDALTAVVEDPAEGMAIHTCDVGDLLDNLYQDKGADSSAAPRQGSSAKGESCVISAAPTQPGGERSLWILRILRDASDALLANDELGATLNVVLDLVFQHLPADRGQILLRHPQTGALERAVRRYRPEAEEQGLEISNNIARQVIESKCAVLVQDTSEDDQYKDLRSIVEWNIRSAMCAPLCHKENVLGVIWLDRTSADSAFDKTHLEVLTILASLSAAAVDRAQLRETVERERAARERLSRYHAPAVVEKIVRGGGTELETSERDISVLFCDIVSFTPLSERLPAKQVTRILNQVFQALTEEVFREGGTLDKFMGDGMMVFFGAPLDQPDHASRAVRTALAMQGRLSKLNDTDAMGMKLAVRIGVNSGPAIVGDVGADIRRDYTVIGDTVNVASRLESSVATPGDVVIGQDTFRRVSSRFRCEALGTVTLKGKEKTLQAYRVQG